MKIDKYCKHCHKKIDDEDTLVTAEAIGAEGKVTHYFHEDCFFSLLAKHC